MNTTAVLQKLIARKDLSEKESRQILLDMAEGKVLPAQIAAILTAFRMKGETPNELAGFIRGMREKMVKIKAKDAIDVCGTGGDDKHTFNISTAVAFVVAGCGVPVVKHGNRSATSSCGSADVLESLGAKIQLSTTQAADTFTKCGITFLFAPIYHPAMKHVASVRKELGIRTLFNVLGPFANPSGVKRQLIGVPTTDIARRLAQAAKRLSYSRLLLVTSADGMDEANTYTNATIFEVSGNKAKRFIVDPASYNFRKSSKQALLGGDANQNARIIVSLLDGEKGARRDTVVFNSGLALYAAATVKNISDGIMRAQESIDNGHAKSVLQHFIRQTQAYA